MHPAAWWVWAAGVVALAGRTQSPAVLGVLGAATLVLAGLGRRPGAPAFSGYLLLGLGIVVARVVFHVLVGVKTPGGVVLVSLPSWRPPWAPSVELLGPVTSTGLARAALGGLALAVMVLAVGAAATASSPSRLLRSVPAALHHLATAAAIAVAVAPSLVRAAGAARRARRLRGLPDRGPRALAETALPVLADALDRAVDLAASMDVRGYARRAGDRSRWALPALVGALLAAALGLYGLLTGDPAYAVPAMGAAIGLGAAGGLLAGRGARRTRYRPDPWRGREWLAAGAGALTLVGAVAGAPPGVLAGVAALGLAALVPPALPAEVAA